MADFFLYIFSLFLDSFLPEGKIWPYNEMSFADKYLVQKDDKIIILKALSSPFQKYKMDGNQRREGASR